MKLRTAGIVAILVTGAVALAGCTPTPAPAPSASSTKAAETATPEPTEAVAPLPADAVLSLTAHATADNGAEVDILLVLLAAEPFNTATAAPRAAATAAWCQGEVDDSVFAMGGGFSFAQLDVTVTPVDGSPAWPADLPLHILPGGGGPTLAPGGAAYAVQKPDDGGSDEPGYYVPHCLQDAFLAVPGTGSLYLGWSDDAATLDDWASSNYGATFDGYGETSDRASLTDCTKVITELGTSMGGSDASLPDFFSATTCRVGSAA